LTDIDDTDLNDPPSSLRLIDYRGHHGYKLDEIIDIDAMAPGWRRGGYERVIQDMERSERLTAITGVRWPSEGQRCGHCAERFYLTKEGDRAVASTACSVPGGLPAYVVLLGVPSGRIVFANDLRSLVVCDEPDGPDVNTVLGCKNVTRAFARTGMVHISVGNTCPSVYAESDDSYVVASRYAEEEDADGEPIDESIVAERESFLDQTRVASICTDLWWFSAMDHAYFLNRCAFEGIDPAEIDHDIVTVGPGTFAFTDEMPRDRDAQGTVFSRIFPVMAAAPAIEDGIEPPARRLVDTYLFRKTLNGNPDSFLGQSCFRRASWAFFVAGNGYDWVHGNLRRTNRQEDRSYLEERTGLGRYARALEHFKPRRHQPLNLVPEFPAYPDTVYPLSWIGAGKISDVPYDVEPYTLVLGMMLAKTALSRPTCFERTGQGRTLAQVRKAVREQQAIMARVLALLIEIASRRGLFRTGAVRRMADELLRHFAQNEAEMAKPVDTSHQELAMKIQGVKF
jgi:hypothetical protein